MQCRPNLAEVNSSIAVSSALPVARATGTVSEPPCIVGMLSCMMRTRIFHWSHVMAKVMEAQGHQDVMVKAPSSVTRRTLSTAERHDTFCLRCGRWPAQPRSFPRANAGPRLALCFVRCHQPSAVAGWPGRLCPPRPENSPEASSCGCFSLVQRPWRGYFEHCRSASTALGADLTRPRRGEENRVRTGTPSRACPPIRWRRTWAIGGHPDTSRRPGKEKGWGLQGCREAGRQGGRAVGMGWWELFVQTARQCLTVRTRILHKAFLGTHHNLTD